MGADVALAATGLCMPTGGTVTIRTDRKRGDLRLVDLRRAFLGYLRTYPVELCVMEKIAPHAVGTASTVATAMAQSQVREVLAEFGVPVAFVHLGTLKRFATGSGAADKRQMVAAVNLARRGGPLRPVHDLDDITDDNQADAWWLWRMGRWFEGDQRALPEFEGAVTGSAEVRNRCVFGPWDRTPGAEWPGLPKRPAPPRRPHRAKPAGR